MSMNYEEALEYIHHVSWIGVKPGLSRTFELLDRMGNPQKQLKFVHIAGTNGKGSTAAMTASILEKSGYRTGLYTSPFIHRFNERMQVNGESITDEELAELTEWIRPMAETMEDSPTEFELITALAMEFFRRQVCDIVVLEVGMGGELDSTNVIDTPEMAVITAIGLDHTAELGDTLGKIASAKGGIIKACGDVVIYPQAEEAEIVLKQMAEEKYCHVFQPDFSAITPVSETLSGQTFDYGKYHGLKIPMAGNYQQRNAAVVVTVCERLAAKGWHITEQNIRDGLANTRWRGRFEVLSEKPAVIVDGSHNPHGIRATAESLRKYFPDGGIIFIIGVCADKDVPHMMEQLVPMAKEFVTTQASYYRAMPAGKLAELMRTMTDLPVTPEADVRKACALALEKAGSDGTVCAMGTLYMVGDVTVSLEDLLKQK